MKGARSGKREPNEGRGEGNCTDHSSGPSPSSPLLAAYDPSGSVALINASIAPNGTALAPDANHDFRGRISVVCDSETKQCLLSLNYN